MKDFGSFIKEKKVYESVDDRKKVSESAHEIYKKRILKTCNNSEKFYDLHINQVLNVLDDDFFETHGELDEAETIASVLEGLFLKVCCSDNYNLKRDNIEEIRDLYYTIANDILP
jgi:hypothetical protein